MVVFPSDSVCKPCDVLRGTGAAQASIYATLIGSDVCVVEGIIARGYAPLCLLCRELVAVGFNPASPLKGWRGETLCLRVRSIGEGARLAVANDRHGTPRLRRRQERQLGYVAGSPVAQKANGRGVANPAQPAAREAAP